MRPRSESKLTRLVLVLSLRPTRGKRNSLLIFPVNAIASLIGIGLVSRPSKPSKRVLHSALIFSASSVLPFKTALTSDASCEGMMFEATLTTPTAPLFINGNVSASSPLKTSYDEGNTSKIRTSEKIGKSLRIVTSRSHTSEKLNTYLKKIDNYKIIPRGSSLKFCLVASGKADIYPRFGPTSEWDIAAGEAIVKFAGGEIIKLDGKPMTYNLKDNLLNPEFIVSANKNISQKLLSLMK